MKKRLRKKLHRGEFRQYGFDLTLHLRPGLSEAQLDALHCGLMEALRLQGAECAGGGGGEMWSLAVAASPGSCGADLLGALTEWLSLRPDVSSFTCSPIYDAWSVSS